jgi:hypothetical protein
MSEVKYMGIKEFREEGYLQELNRRFLHPLGLALEVVINADGTERLGGVWDFRDDPEGMIYGEDTIEVEKVQHIRQIENGRTTARLDALGFWVQPVTE